VLQRLLGNTEFFEAKLELGDIQEDETEAVLTKEPKQSG
jgi:hypothetical protein